MVIITCQDLTCHMLIPSYMPSIMGRMNKVKGNRELVCNATVAGGGSGGASGRGSPPNSSSSPSSSDDRYRDRGFVRDRDCDRDRDRGRYRNKTEQEEAGQASE